MNVQPLTEAIKRGEKLLIVTQSHQAVRDIISELRDDHDPFIKVSVTYGQERARDLSSHGELSFATSRQVRRYGAVRGRTFDQIILCDGLHDSQGRPTDPELAHALSPALRRRDG